MTQDESSAPDSQLIYFCLDSTEHVLGEECGRRRTSRSVLLHSHQLGIQRIIPCKRFHSSAGDETTRPVCGNKASMTVKICIHALSVL